MVILNKIEGITKNLEHLERVKDTQSIYLRKDSSLDETQLEVL